jgi:hypothetical protein
MNKKFKFLKIKCLTYAGIGFLNSVISFLSFMIYLCRNAKKFIKWSLKEDNRGKTILNSTLLELYKADKKLKNK